MSHARDSLEAGTTLDPFLHGVPATVEALRANQIECRVYDRDKFHAKAYITHAKLEVVGSQALVGSSNFTALGLTKNVELNIQVQSAREVAELQEWFEEYWEEATDVTAAIIETVSRHIRLYTPFDFVVLGVLILAGLVALIIIEPYRLQRVTSFVNPFDDPFNTGYQLSQALIAFGRGEWFGVGLGKTRRPLIRSERLRVRRLRQRHGSQCIGDAGPEAQLEQGRGAEDTEGLGGSADFSNLAVFSHTDLNRRGDFPDRFRRIAELADAVIIDEAHHFRNRGTEGNEEEGKAPSRYHRLYELLDDSIRPKAVFMLTATPINNRLSDLRHMIELFSRGDEAHFARTLGVNNLRGHFNNMEKALREKVGHDVTDVAEVITEAQDILVKDPIFNELVVQRSRAYARESQIRQRGAAAVFPDRRAPQVAAYSIRKTYGHLLDMFEKAFQRANPLFTLPMYYPLHWYTGDDMTIDPFDQNRQKQVVGLIRTNFLKRFESSVAAFEMSCDRLIKKLLAFLEVHSETDGEKRRLERWKVQNAEVLGYALQRQLDFWGDNGDESDDDDIVPQELLDAVERLDRECFDVPEMMQETLLDLDQIVQFIAEARKFEPKHDDKLVKLIRLLKSKDLADQKVLIFSEFADTARYLKAQLDRAGIDGVTQVDSATKASRADVIQRFSPYYNGLSSSALADKGRSEIRVLIATDVLSEGLNLQDASRMINYDIHWNPVRLMQRIGRVDRRMNPAVEEQLVADHPELAAGRGKIAFWNFLPPEQLNAILTLYTKVTQKTLMISKTLGIEGKKLLTPDDDYDALKEFNAVLARLASGAAPVIDGTHALFQQDVVFAGLGLQLPGGVFSGRKRLSRGARGVFFCYALPALDKETGEFTEAAGTARWYLYDLDRDVILDEPGEIVGSIRSKPNTPRRCSIDEKTLVDARAKLEKHLKNTYLKRVDAPIGVKPTLKCWMELNEG